MQETGNEYVTMKMQLGSGQGRTSLETLLNSFGRIGGPTEFGWHTHEAALRCWREDHLSATTTEVRSPGQMFALAVGTIAHEFLAAYYAAFIHDKPSNPENSEPEELYSYLCAHAYADEANEAKRLYDAYQEKYASCDSYLGADVRVIAIEHQVRRDLPWGQPYTARADMVLRLPDGYWLVDHKTTAARTAEFIEGWQSEPSIIGLVWACSSTFDPVRGVSINGVIKTKRPDFDRLMYARDNRMIEDWLSMMHWKWQESVRAKEAGWPPNYTACFRKMGAHVGKCRYFSRCVYGVVDDMVRS